MKEPRTVHFLVIEDDDVDAMAVDRAFRKLRIANPMTRARDGLEGLELLRSGELEGPVLILLDLNMPRMDGLEFLTELRADPVLHKTVVFVLTTSAADEDRIAAYEQHVAGYIVKTDLENGFLDVAQLLQSYWRLVELP